MEQVESVALHFRFFEKCCKKPMNMMASKVTYLESALNREGGAEAIRNIEISCMGFAILDNTS